MPAKTNTQLNAEREARRRKKMQEDPEYRAAYYQRKAAAKKARCEVDPEYREHVNIKSAEYRKRRPKRESTPESRARAAAYQKARLDADPEARQNARESVRRSYAKKMADPAYREAFRERQRAQRLAQRVEWVASPEYLVWLEEKVKWRAGARQRAVEKLKQRYHEDEIYRMRTTAAKLMNAALKYPEQPRNWHKYFGYTLHELRAHLESKFSTGMTWDNRSEWHIDHIKPVCLFSFSSYRDPVWEDMWALENLQPLWAGDNIRKGRKLDWAPTENSKKSTNETLKNSNNTKNLTFPHFPL